MRRSTIAAAAAALTALAAAARPMAQPMPFQIEEATIAQVHAEMRAKRLTCRALVDHYLRRIEAYDKQGPAINAIVVVNPRARDEADEMDRRYAASGPIGPLHWACTDIAGVGNMHMDGAILSGRAAADAVLASL